MKLMVSSYNTGGSWNKEEEETKLRTYTIDHSFNESAKCNIVLADVDGSRMRKYRTDTGIDLSAGIEDDGGAQTDETTETNSAAANDMTLTPAGGGTWNINDAYYYGFAEEIGGFVLNIGQDLVPAAADPVLVWEYWDGDSWETLADISDGSDKYMNSGKVSISWTIPGDWATSTENGQGPFYYVRGRVTTACDITTQALGTQAWYNRIWLGPGKVTLEDPTNTDVFYGRIVKVISNFDNRTLLLECRDWLDQLDEEQITYDMREKLGTTDMRQSMGRSDVDGGRVVAEDDAGTYYFYDDGDYDVAGGMGFANDQHNGQYLIFTSGMAGTNTWTFHPYDSTPTDEDAYDDNVELVWADSGFTEACSANNDFTLDYHFHVELGHNTPSDFYVHGSIESAKVVCRHMVSEVPSTNHAHIEIYDNDAAGWVALDELSEKDVLKWMEHPVPLNVVPYITDATGEADIRYNVDRAGGDATITLAYVALEVTATTTGYSIPILINDTINPNKIEVATDLTAAATRIWEGIPYCIARKIYEHIDSAEVGTLISDGDIIVPLTHAGTIEHTSGISTRQYKNRTRMQIIQDLAIQDKSVFWLALGTTTLISKQTFGANTETMTDATPDNWQSQRDYGFLVNSVDVYGARIGDYEIYQQSQDADSISTYYATRSKVIKNTGLVSDADASAIGTALAARDANISQMVGCTLSGFDTTYRLGTIVEITSSYLWTTAAKDYIVTRWAYDSAQHKTFLTMHPKVSIGLQEVDTFMAEGERIKRRTELAELDKVVNDPVTHEVA